MAKKSSTEKNNRRIRLVKRFAASLQFLAGETRAFELLLVGVDRFCGRVGKVLVFFCHRLMLIDNRG